MLRHLDMVVQRSFCICDCVNPSRGAINAELLRKSHVMFVSEQKTAKGCGLNVGLSNKSIFSKDTSANHR